MDRVPRIQELYRELSQIEADMTPFITPRSADNPIVWTPEDLDRYYNLRKCRDEIVVELAKLEGGMP